MFFLGRLKGAPARAPRPLPRYRLDDETLAQLLDASVRSDAPVIALDADGVLLEFEQAFRMFAANAGVSAKVEAGAATALTRDGAPLPPEEARALLHKFFLTGAASQEPMPGAVGAVARLSRLAEIVILTAAPPAAAIRRTAHLRRCGFAAPVVCVSGGKGRALRFLWDHGVGPMVFVDDSPRQIASAKRHAPGVSALRFGAPEAPDWTALLIRLEAMDWRA